MHYRVDVGNNDTTDPTSVVEERLAIEIYPPDNKSVVVEFFAQYNDNAHEPDIISPNATKNKNQNYNSKLCKRGME